MGRNLNKKWINNTGWGGGDEKSNPRGWLRGEKYIHKDTNIDMETGYESEYSSSKSIILYTQKRMWKKVKSGWFIAFA